MDVFERRGNVAVFQFLLLYSDDGCVGEACSGFACCLSILIIVFLSVFVAEFPAPVGLLSILIIVFLGHSNPTLPTTLTSTFQFLLLYSGTCPIGAKPPSNGAFNSYYCIQFLLLYSSASLNFLSKSSSAFQFLLLYSRGVYSWSWRGGWGRDFQFLLLYSKRDLLPKFLNIVFDTYLVR